MSPLKCFQANCSFKKKKQQRLFRLQLSVKDGELSSREDDPCVCRPAGCCRMITNRFALQPCRWSGCSASSTQKGKDVSGANSLRELSFTHSVTSSQHSHCRDGFFILDVFQHRTRSTTLVLCCFTIWLSSDTSVYYL